PDGGAIEMTANDPAHVGAVRRQVANIVAMFGQGKFEVPAVTRGRNPPGADRMSQLKGDISYAAENLPAGGRVRITTANSEARKASAFLTSFAASGHTARLAARQDERHSLLTRATLASGLKATQLRPLAKAALRKGQFTGLSQFRRTRARVSPHAGDRRS